MNVLPHEVLALASAGALAFGFYAAVRGEREEGAAARAKWRLVAGAGLLLGFLGLAFYRLS